VTTQAFHDFDALGDGRAEMSRALDQITLIKIVGADAQHCQLVDQFALNVDGVVDAGQQHRLIAERHPGAGEAVAGFREFEGNLVRMIDVDVHPDWVILRQHVAEFLIHPLRQEDRHA